MDEQCYSGFCFIHVPRLISVHAHRKKDVCANLTAVQRLWSRKSDIDKLQNIAEHLPVFAITRVELCSKK